MRHGKLIFGVLALIMIALGLGVYLFSAVLGINPDTAKVIALAFAFTGVLDYLVLVFWDRIFDRFQ